MVVLAKHNHICTDKNLFIAFIHQTRILSNPALFNYSELIFDTDTYLLFILLKFVLGPIICMVLCNKFNVAIPFNNRICTTRVSVKAINVLSRTAPPYLLDVKRRCDGVGVGPGGCFPSVKTRKWRSLSRLPTRQPERTQVCCLVTSPSTRFPPTLRALNICLFNQYGFSSLEIITAVNHVNYQGPR